MPLIGDPTYINFIFLAIIIFGIVLAAAVPSTVLSSQNFATILRNRYTSNVGNVGLRRVLVIMQFSISTVLVISIIVITKQLEYMDSKDKGINIANTLIVKSPKEKDTWQRKIERLELFKKKCEDLQFVIGVTSSTTVPGEEYRHEAYLSLQEKSEKLLVYLNGVDDRFLDLYEVKFIAGNDFIPDARWKNKRSIILNESAASALGIVDFDKMLHSKVVDHGTDKSYELIGIVKNYHKTSH